MQLKAQDVKLLNLLYQRHHLSLKGISRKAGISAYFLQKKLGEFHKQGVIQGWTINLHPNALNSKMLMLFLKTNPNEPEVIKNIKKRYSSSELLFIEGITGEFSIVGFFNFSTTEAFLESLDHLYELIGRTNFQRYNLIELIKAYKFEGQNLTTSVNKISEKDLKLINVINSLGVNSIIPPTIEKIVKLTNLSRASIYRRFKELQNQGVLINYSIKSGHLHSHTITTLIQIKLQQKSRKHLIAYCKEEDCVQSLFRTNQDYSFLLTTHHTSLKELNEFLMVLYNKCNIVDSISTISLGRVI
jgi:DNA-binding Lrp family transcriptional regulator